ncbi:MAG: YihY/virulence factor BrkB family protein [Verrucomicrobiales bacterium]
MNHGQLTGRRLAALMRQTAQEWRQDNIPRLSAALSYYAIFALSPLVLLILTLGGAWLGEAHTRGQLDIQMQGALGTTTAEAVGNLVEVPERPPTSLPAALGSLAFLLFGATRLFGELKEALNLIWGVEKPRGKALRAWGRKRLVSMAMVAVLMVLFLLSMAFSMAVTAGAGAVQRWISIPPVLWSLTGLGLGLVMETVLFALMFHILPDVKFPRRDVWLGAGLTAVLFELGKLALGWFLSRDLATPGDGPAGSVMIVLLWVYYTSIIVLSGAEFTQVQSRWRYSPDRHHGSSNS